MGVSLCLIVKNEEKRVERCLDSFSSLADEIIVVDTGSNDGTKEAAERKRAKVFDFEWGNDFSEARNFALAQAKQEWVTMVDADDTIDSQSIQKIKEVIASANRNVQIIALPYVYSATEGRKGQTAWLPKMWRKNLNLKYKLPVHEILDTAEINEKSWVQVNAPLIHQKEDEDIPGSLSRNIGIMLPYVEKNPHDLRMLYYLAHDHRHLGKFKEAIHWCEAYLNSNPKELVRIGKVLVLQGVCHLKLEMDLEAQASFLMAIGAQPLLVEPYLELGDLYWKNKRREESIHMYRCAELCKIPKGSPYFYDQAAYETFAIRKLAFALSEVGRKKEALEYANRTLAFMPEDKALARLVRTLTKAE